ncbi:MAG: sulfite exporter TauE/SafE family protein [Pseudomonadota bacterium]
MSSDIFLLFIVSFIANTFSAVAGGGAGLIQLPVLIFLGLPFSLALATHKVASVALGLGATIRHLRSGSIDLFFSLFILFSGLPGVILGGFIIVKLDSVTAELLLACLTISLGIYSIKQPQLGQQYQVRHRNKFGYIVGAIVLMVIGILNGSLTSGTGLFVTMWLIYWFGLDYKRAIAYTLILVGIFWNGTGAITLGFLSEIKWDWLPALLLGSLSGGYFGAHLAIKSGNQWIKRIFEFLTISIGLSLIIRNL